MNSIDSTMKMRSADFAKKDALLPATLNQLLFAIVMVVIVTMFTNQAEALRIDLTITCAPSGSLLGDPFASTPDVVLTGTGMFYSVDATGAFTTLVPPTGVRVETGMTSTIKFNMSSSKDAQLYFYFLGTMASESLGISIPVWTSGPPYYNPETGDPVLLGTRMPGLDVGGSVYGGQWDRAGYWDVTSPGRPVREPAILQVTSTTPVPEPSTLLLLGAGIAGLVFWRRKKVPEIMDQ